MDYLEELIAAGESVINNSKILDKDTLDSQKLANKSNLHTPFSTSSSNNQKEYSSHNKNDSAYSECSTSNSLSLKNSIEISTKQFNNGTSPNALQNEDVQQYYNNDDDISSNDNLISKRSIEELNSEQCLLSLKDECASIFSISLSMSSSLSNANRLLSSIAKTCTGTLNMEENLVQEISTCNENCKENEAKLNKCASKIHMILAKLTESYNKSCEQSDELQNIEEHSLAISHLTEELLLQNGLSTLISTNELESKDVRNAVEAAHKGHSVWSSRSGFNRSQILFYMAENLDQRRKEYIEHLFNLTGQSKKVSENEVDAAIQRLFYWAAYCDKYGGAIQETQIYGTVLRLHEPIGVIGIACPEENPLLGFVSLVAPAIARGNSVVVIPSEMHPTLAISLYQILETSDVPGGVINILTGNKDHLTKYLTEHQDVQAMWYFGSHEGSTFVESVSSTNLKRTWVNNGFSRDWFNNDQGQGPEFLYHSVQVKNVWLTIGDIFAN